MIHVKRRFLIGNLIIRYVLMLIAGFFAMNCDAAKSDGVEIFFKLSSSSYSVHEPIYIDVALENKLPEPVLFDLGLNRITKYVFTLDGPNNSGGIALRLPEEGFGGMGKITLNSNSTYRQRLLFNEWIQLTNPGYYKIIPKLDTEFKTKSGQAVTPRLLSNIELNLVARSEARLKEVCASLISSIQKSDDVSLSMFAAKSLSYIADPVAVPFQQKLLFESKFLKEVAINGLARVGNREAVEVLIKAAKEEGPEISGLARFALSNVAAKTSDSSLRDDIKNYMGQ